MIIIIYIYIYYIMLYYIILYIYEIKSVDSMTRHAKIGGQALTNAIIYIYSSGCYILLCLRYIMIRHTFFDYTYRLENQ